MIHQYIYFCRSEHHCHGLNLEIVLWRQQDHRDLILLQISTRGNETVNVL